MYLLKIVAKEIVNFTKCAFVHIVITCIDEF